MAVTRNTPVLRQIVEALNGQLSNQDIALMQLEEFYRDDLLVNAGNIQTIIDDAKELRLDLTKEECAQVLDSIAAQAMVSITLEHVETAAYALFVNRFIEPYPRPAMKRLVSIHAPARGATLSPIAMFPYPEVSIHAPARGATAEITKQQRRVEVSIHAPARGATVGGSLQRIDDAVSIHAPARGAT